MLNRDFSKSNKDYLNKNKFMLIGVAVFLVLGLILGLIFGFNANFEIKGYNEFTIKAKESLVVEYKNINEITSILNDKGGNCDLVLTSKNGDNSKFVVRYLNDLSEENVVEVNKLISEKLEIETDAISEHLKAKPIAKANDYIFTAVAILVLLVAACIFAYFRYNIASAMTVVISSVFGTAAFMCLGIILRLPIGMSYFGMLVILNMLVVFANFDIFENMRKTSWLNSGDYKSAIDSALKDSKFRICAISIALMVMAVLFVLTASTIKYVALNLLFIPVVFALVAFYAIPFVWSVFITIFKKRKYTVKNMENNEKD